MASIKAIFTKVLAAETFLKPLLRATANIRVQMALAISLFSLFMILILFALIFTITHEQLSQQKIHSIQEEAEGLSQVISRQLEDFNYVAVDDLVKMAINSPNINAIQVKNEFRQKISAHPESAQLSSDKLFKKRLYSHQQPTKEVGELQIHWVMPETLLDTGPLYWLLIAFCLVFMIILATLIYYYLAFSIARPLNQLEKKLASFDQNRTLPTSRFIPREIQSLHEHYEHMAEKVRKQMEHLETLAHTDTLTQLANRKDIEKAITQQIPLSKKTGVNFAVIFLDLDHFKQINDVYGHSIGDQVLIGFAGVLKASTDNEVVLGRFGGDEFIILIKDVQRVETVIKAIYQNLDNDFIFCGRRVFLSVSMGIAVYPLDGEQPDDLLRNADTALYESKRSGRNQASYFSQRMKVAAGQWLGAIDLIRSAIQQNRLLFHWQAIVNKDKQIEYHELLLRLVKNDGSLVYPDIFLPVAEENGLMSNIAEFTCQSALDLFKSGLTNSKISLNFSHSQLMLPTLNKMLAPLLPWKKRIIIEVTEETFLGTKKTRDILFRLRKKGFTIALDDFGSGYSSLALLLDLPIDIIKLDKEFQKNIHQHPKARALLKSIINMLKSLGKIIIAEGIQNKTQHDFAVAAGCDYLQGYYLYKPCPIDRKPTLQKLTTKEVCHESPANT